MDLKMNNQCQFIKKNGKRCEAFTIKNSNYCFSHNPDLKKEKMLAVKKGGLAKKRFLLNYQDKVVLETAKDAKNFLALVINEVWQGKIPSTPVASTLGFLVRCFLDAFEKSEIETKISDIERKIEEKQL